MEKELVIQRYSDNGESTQSLMFWDKLFENYSLENNFSVEKEEDGGRIPYGVWEMRLHKHETALTKKYRKLYPWFTWHIEIIVPGFDNVYIHVGNKSEHTLACVLVADTANNNQEDKGFIGVSVRAFKDLYQKIVPYLEEHDVARVIIYEPKNIWL